MDGTLELLSFWTYQLVFISNQNEQPAKSHQKEPTNLVTRHFVQNPLKNGFYGLDFDHQKATK